MRLREFRKKKIRLMNVTDKKIEKNKRNKEYKEK